MVKLSVVIWILLDCNYYILTKDNKFVIIFKGGKMSIEFKPEQPLHEVEKVYIISALDYFKGNKMLAAKSLGISTKTLYNKLHQFDLFTKYAKVKMDGVDEIQG